MVETSVRLGRGDDHRGERGGEGEAKKQAIKRRVSCRGTTGRFAGRSSYREGGHPPVAAEPSIDGERLLVTGPAPAPDGQASYRSLHFARNRLHSAVR